MPQHVVLAETFQRRWHILQQVKLEANVCKLGQVDRLELRLLLEVVDEESGPLIDLQSRRVLRQVVQEDVADIALRHKEQRLVEGAF